MLGGMSETIDVLRGTKDWRGDGGLDVSHQIHDVLIQVDMTTMSTDRDRREDWVVVGTMWMPTGSDIKAGDRVQLPDTVGFGAGELVAIEGKPFVWKLNTWQPGIGVRFRGVNNNGTRTDGS